MLCSWKPWDLGALLKFRPVANISKDAHAHEHKVCFALSRALAEVVFLKSCWFFQGWHSIKKPWRLRAQVVLLKS